MHWCQLRGKKKKTGSRLKVVLFGSDHGLSLYT